MHRVRFLPNETSRGDSIVRAIALGTNRLHRQHAHPLLRALVQSLMHRIWPLRFAPRPEFGLCATRLAARAGTRSCRFGRVRLLRPNWSTILRGVVAAGDSL